MADDNRVFKPHLVGGCINRRRPPRSSFRPLALRRRSAGSAALQSAVTALEENLQARGFEFVRVRPEVNRNINSLTLDFDLVFEKGERLFIEGW